MSQTLTSWKEIAAYFGKGVRTVQRWERSLGLPIHRPDGGAKNIVLASPSELDAWVAASPRSHHSAIATLEENLSRIEQLELENSDLKQQLAAFTELAT